MSGAFSFSGDELASFPQRALASTLVWGDIEKTLHSPEVGDGRIADDGSITIEYQTFSITLRPDGSFSGHRKTASDRAV